MTQAVRAALAALITLALPALAQQPAETAADPMAGWKPPVVKSEKKDRQEIEAMLKKMEAASTKGDLDAAAALVDFPVLMVTDDSRGEAAGQTWTREQWVEVMRPFYAKPMPPGTVTMSKPTIVVVSDSLALVGSPWAMRMGQKKVTGTSGMVVIRAGGTWKAKAMIEGGWGDMMQASQGGTQPGTEPGAQPGAEPPAKTP